MAAASQTAQAYLDAHGVEDAVAEAIERVLSDRRTDRPEQDPLGALAAALRAISAANGGGGSGDGAAGGARAPRTPVKGTRSSAAVPASPSADDPPEVKFYRVERGPQYWPASAAPPVKPKGFTATTPHYGRKCFRIPRNGTTPSAIDNENFEGCVVALHRPTAGDGDLSGDPYKWHFQGKSRLWEFRLQGRLKRLPTGKLYVGVVLDEFGYDAKPNAAANFLERVGIPLLLEHAPRACIHKRISSCGWHVHGMRAQVGIPLLRRSLGQDIAYSSGDRVEMLLGNADPEKQRIVADWTGWDQVCVWHARTCTPCMYTHCIQLTHASWPTGPGGTRSS